MHRASAHGTHRVVTHSRKMHFSAHGTSCATSPVLSSSKEACSEEQRRCDEPSAETLAMCRNGYVFYTVVKMHVQRNTFFSGSFITWAIVTQMSHNKLHNWHIDSSRRSIVQRSRERTAPGISSWTSLKCCIHFSFILRLTIFIYKQLKRPVAFSAVHSFTNNSKGL